MAALMGNVYDPIQVYVCLGVVVIGSMMVPRFFKNTWTTLRTGLEAYIGKTAMIHIVNGVAKVSLDGVDHRIDSDSELVEWDKVTITGRDGTILQVKK